MTPAERAVIEAARAWAIKMSEGVWDGVTGSLLAAVAALDVAEAAPVPEVVELDVTWAEVCSGDLMYSANTGRWIEALEVRPRADGQVSIRVTGGQAGKPPITFTRPSTTLVKVRRASAMASAVDALASVVWSGPA